MFKLRPYQKQDVLKLGKLKCSACLNEQRTGKTPTALMLMYYQQHKKILIVCPGVALYRWKEDFEKWLQRPCIVLDGNHIQRQKKLQQWTDGLVITYDTLKIVKRVINGEVQETGELYEILKHNIDAVIVDEFHRARNRQTATTKALFKLIPKIQYRVALTGTPAYSKPQDIWTMLHFLYPKIFKSYWTFITQFFEVNMKWTPHGMARDIGPLKKEKEFELQHFLDQISTQRKQHDPDVMPWLPAKPIPQIIRLPATPLQTKHLNMLMEYYETENVICQTPLDRLTRYRQICQDPRLLDLKGGSAKTDFVQQYFKDYPETPTIFFSTFTSYLELLASDCPVSWATITGNTALKRRKDIETQFQKGEIQALFINIKAGKENLTLDRAERIVFLDKYPPIGDILQASERFTATNIKTKDIPKEIWELVIKDTFEEQINEGLAMSKNETEILNDFTKYIH